MTTSCCCFEGFRKGGKPDSSPAARRFDKSRLASRSSEAAAIDRPNAGSWTAPQRQTWASPAPRYPQETLMVNLDNLDDFVVGARKERRVQLDVDSELRRADVLSKLRPDKRSKFEVEQLVASPGNLPRPMTVDEREQVIRGLLPTATYSMLSKISSQVVQAPGVEGQALRRKLVHGATVVFFTAGYEGKRFVFERARDLGIKCVIIEHPDSWSRKLVDEGVIAKFIPVDMSQSSDRILAESLELIKGLGQDGLVGEADAIVTFVELSVPVVARLCESLGLPGSSSVAVDCARDKHATRAAMKAAGLPTPLNALIHSEEEVDQAAQIVGFPAVLKPISGAASLGVKKVNAREELLDCYREVLAELRSMVVVSGALEKGDGTGNGVRAESSIPLTLLLEQYLDGDEVDIDIVMSEGQWRYASITDNGPTLEPYFNETWGVCPSLLPIEQQRELKDFAVKTLLAMGFPSGVFHVECKYTSTGPQLIEVNARMGGGPVHAMCSRTWGVDLAEEAILIALGIPSRPLVPPVPLVATAYYVVPASVSGTVKQMPELNRLQQASDVVWAKPMVRPGDQITGPADGMPTWLMDILVEKPTAQEAYDFVMKLEAENQVVIG